MNAVLDLGLDPSGVKDSSAKLQSYLDSSISVNNELWFPEGTYRFDSSIYTNQKGVMLKGIGALQNMGDSPVVFFTDKALEAILWWDGSLTNSNLNGPRLEGIQFQDRGGKLVCAVKLTAIANAELKIGFLGLKPRRYTAGSIVTSSGSKTIRGTGTSWTDAMTPGWIVIAGYPYEIKSVDAGDALTLAIKYQGGSASLNTYAINYGGIGVWLDPGTDFTQYGKNWSLNGRCGCGLFASAGSTSPKFTGTSRIKVLSGYLNGEGIPDSIALYAGPFSDTFVFDVALNSYAFGVVIANGHQHDFQHLDVENAGGPPPVTGLPNSYDSCHGILVMSDNSSDAYGNRIGGYFRQVGTGIELYGSPGSAPTKTMFGVCTFRSNKVNFVSGNATNSGGIVPTASSRRGSLMQKLLDWFHAHNYVTHALAGAIVALAILVQTDETIRSMLLKDLDIHPKIISTLACLGAILLAYKQPKKEAPLPPPAAEPEKKG